MKKVLLLLISGVFSLALAAQHPLEGTWEMVSIRGINADGEKFYLDTTTVRETKIITATHYMLLARDKEADTWTFNRCYAGTVRMDGNKYYEYPVMSSLRIFENVTTDFQWKVEKDRFIQTGTITRPDGKKIILEEFIFRRLKGPSGLPGKSFTGTWSIPSGDNLNGMLIITPTHWMKIVKNSDKLVDASGGVVRNADGKVSLETQFGSDTLATPGHQVERSGNLINVDGASYERSAVGTY